MTQKEIKEAQKRVSEIWKEIDEVIAGTGVGALIDELVELEIQLEQECNQ